MSMIEKNPPVIIDGAHTEQSMRHLFNSFTSWFPEGQRIVIFGALEDKDILHMARIIIAQSDHIIISRPGTFKKSNTTATFQLFQTEILRQRASSRLYLEEEADAALALALSLSENSSPILCTGSFYLGGEILLSHRRLKQTRECVSCP